MMGDEPIRALKLGLQFAEVSVRSEVVEEEGMHADLTELKEWIVWQENEKLIQLSFICPTTFTMMTFAKMLGYVFS